MHTTYLFTYHKAIIQRTYTKPDKEISLTPQVAFLLMQLHAFRHKSLADKTAPCALIHRLLVSAASSLLHKRNIYFPYYIYVIYIYSAAIAETGYPLTACSSNSSMRMSASISWVSIVPKSALSLLKATRTTSR
jgi:hypothetical protein